MCVTCTTCLLSDWPDRSRFFGAPRLVWRSPAPQNRVFGYVRAMENVTVVVVAQAGHFVPMDAVSKRQQGRDWRRAVHDDDHGTDVSSCIAMPLCMPCLYATSVHV